ncbi:MAG TPA: cytochrome C oxidase subunit IV family protein [Longimicrobiales bacterium]
MSTSTEVADTSQHQHEGTEHEHPSDLKYIKVAIVLGVITAAEVAVYYLDISDAALTALLFPMMIAKFAFVAAYFMHLKFDSPVFTRMFGAGLAFAIVVYIVMLTAFRFWE